MNQSSVAGSSWPPPAKASQGASPKREKKVVLVVDDEQGIRDMLGWCLVGGEYEIVPARDGEEASRCLAAGGIDLVVTDVTMPSFGGFGVLERAAAAGVPAIVMTGFGTVEMAVHAMRLGARDFLLKPFDPERMAERIEEILAGSPEGSR